MVALVIAHAKNGVIGKDNTIPWRVRADLVRLKNLTLGNVVILGRKTYESMAWYYDRSGRDMPGKVYIVVTNNLGYKPSHFNATAVHSMKEAFKVARSLDEDTYVIGGAAIFEEALPFADTIYRTIIQAEVNGDTYAPELKSGDWHETEHEEHKKDEKNEYDYTFSTLKRTKNERL